MNYELLHELVDQLQQYEKEGGAPKTSDFAFWLNQKLQTSPKPKEMPTTRPEEEIAISLGLLYKHARHYIKKALADTPLSSSDDFAFLATLLEVGDLRKSDLIRYNLSDFSPGMEVIRRLIRKGLVEDYDDPDDGRSKKVTPTERGKAALIHCLTDMHKASDIISKILDEEEKAQFVLIARKLLHFHREIWENAQEEPLDDIIKEYLD
jgi:DNA-binding MarR family transcriptional regulator